MFSGGSSRVVGAGRVQRVPDRSASLSDSPHRPPESTRYKLQPTSTDQIHSATELFNALAGSVGSSHGFLRASRSA